MGQIQGQMRQLQTKVNSDRKAFASTVDMQTQLQNKVPSSNPKYAAISSGVSESTKTRASFDSLSNEIGSALTEF